jgi:hypothetical protein
MSWVVAMVARAGLIFTASRFSCVRAPAIDAAGEAFFESKIRPLLVERCLECHGVEKHKSGLRLDSRAGWQAGGERGSPAVPGKPEESLLIKAVRYADKELQMPPKKKEENSRTPRSRRWWSGEDGRRIRGANKFKVQIQNSSSEHWAFRPVQKPSIPGAVGKDLIDAFVMKSSWRLV